MCNVVERLKSIKRIENSQMPIEHICDDNNSLHGNSSQIFCFDNIHLNSKFKYLY